MSRNRFYMEPHPNQGSELKRIVGRFFMVQSANISPEPDGNGNPKVDWPGRTIYPGTKAGRAAAQQCAKSLAGKYPGLGFYVMESVYLYKVNAPEGSEQPIPRLK